MKQKIRGRASRKNRLIRGKTKASAKLAAFAEASTSDLTLLHLAAGLGDFATSSSHDFAAALDFKGKLNLLWTGISKTSF